MQWSRQVFLPPPSRASRHYATRTGDHRTVCVSGSGDSPRVTTRVIKCTAAVDRPSWHAKARGRLRLPAEFYHTLSFWKIIIQYTSLQKYDSIFQLLASNHLFLWAEAAPAAFHWNCYYLFALHNESQTHLWLFAPSLKCLHQEEIFI